MEFGKQANMGGKWVFVSLTNEEIEKALEELLEMNNIQLRLCMNKVSDMDYGNDMKLQMALALLEKNGIASYTFLSSKLDQKIAEMKGKKPYKPVQPETLKKAEEVAEKKLAEKPKIENEEPSLIDEVFSQMNDGEMRTSS